MADLVAVPVQKFQQGVRHPDAQTALDGMMIRIRDRIPSWLKF